MAEPKVAKRRRSAFTTPDTPVAAASSKRRCSAPVPSMYPARSAMARRVAYKSLSKFAVPPSGRVGAAKISRPSTMLVPFRRHPSAVLAKPEITSSVGTKPVRLPALSMAV